jgi:hypothetical protein
VPCESTEGAACVRPRRKKTPPRRRGLDAKPGRVLREAKGRGLEPVAFSSENLGIEAGRGTASGTVGADLDLKAALAMIERLPLSDEEKAQAVRRLLKH